MFGGRRPVVQIIVTKHDRPTTIPHPIARPAAGPASTTGPATGPVRADGPITGSGAPTSTAPAPVAPTAPTAPEAQATGSTGSSDSTENPANTRGADKAPSGTLAGSGTGRMAAPGRSAETTSSTERASSHPVFGYLEGNPAPVSAETIDRHLCDTGYLAILFSESGQPLNVGREERLFNREQRRALAARDGGCRWPGCDQPPSWTEAHHIDMWSDQGLSNINFAIMLCAHHHLLLHNRHWKIYLQGGEYWLQPPVEIDPEQTLIYLPSQNPLLQAPERLDLPTPATPATGRADRGKLRDGGLDGLDPRTGDYPRPGYPNDDYRN
ncbi:HNH endonuclease [Cryobacterium levicorallinum]|uniref:HNH endonuclease n=2 Tax=Cryobacterium levicorallinum TaxID=995038 RepID=A0A4R8VL19_9MICO|nr:HNH endonuclease [Cryobacterium levicorallinum]